MTASSARRHVVDSVGGQQAARVLVEHRDLVRRRDVERIDQVIRHPARIGVDRLGRQFDALGVQRREHGRDPDRPAGRIGGDGRIELGVRGEPPGAVDDDPNREPDLAVEHRRLELAVAQVHELGGDPVDPQVGIARPGRPRGAQRGVCQRLAREC